MIVDFFLLLVALVAQLWRESHTRFLVVWVMGLVLGGLAWWLTSWVAHNFNRQFSLHLLHHVFCGVVATLTLLFTLLFSAFQYTGEVAENKVKEWKDNILVDRKWSENTYRQAYEAVYELRDASGKQLENFVGHPHPDTGHETSIPTNSQESRQVAAQIYANGAVSHFRSHYPFLSKILWAHPELAKEVITKDMERVFGSGAHIYQPQDAIQLASEQIRQGLKEQAPRIVTISRVILIFAFLLVQGITYLLMIRAALRKISVPKSQQQYVGG